MSDKLCQQIIDAAKKEVVTPESVKEFEDRIKKAENVFHAQAVARGAASPLDKPWPESTHST